MSEFDFDKQQDADMAILEKHANALMEHFDNVQIFVTRCDPAVVDGTINATFGLGNWFARYGQVKNWINGEERRE